MRKRERIEKPEDKIWREWFEKLGPQDHKQYMGKLGLTDEDLQELPEIEEQLNSLPAGDGRTGMEAQVEEKKVKEIEKKINGKREKK